MAGSEMCGPAPVLQNTGNTMKFNGCGLMALINVILTSLFMSGQILTPDIVEIKLYFVTSLCIELISAYRL
jgi:hypothetical protein